MYQLFQARPKISPYISGLLMFFFFRLYSSCISLKGESVLNDQAGGLQFFVYFYYMFLSQATRRYFYKNETLNSVNMIKKQDKKLQMGGGYRYLPTFFFDQIHYDLSYQKFNFSLIGLILTHILHLIEHRVIDTVLFRVFFFNQIPNYFMDRIIRK